MNRSAILGLIVLAASPCVTASRASADAPILSDGVDRIDAANRAYYAVPSRDGRSTVVYGAAGGKKQARVWTMPGWHPVAYLSDDGEYLVVGYPGGNLLPLDHPPDVAMLSFFHRGKAVGVVRLNQMIQDRGHLRRTVSHFAWGNFAGFVAPHSFAVDTIEDRHLVYDVTTGARIASAEVDSDGKDGSPSAKRR